MNQPFLTYSNGESKPVRNLGWLLRNADRVYGFRVEPNRYQPDQYPVRLFAYLHDHGNRKLPSGFQAPFADPGILRRWLERPRFMGQWLDWNGHTFELGSTADATTTHNGEGPYGHLQGAWITLGELVVASRTGSEFTGTVIRITPGLGTVTVVPREGQPVPVIRTAVRPWRNTPADRRAAGLENPS